MRKFYLFLSFTICLLACLSAQAKTATVTINDPDGAAVINTSYEYMPINFTDGKAENVEIGTEGGLQVSTNRGYDLKEIKVNETVVYGNYVSASEIPDAALVAITVEKMQAKHVTFTVDNPAAVSLYNTVSYTTLNFDESGKLELDLEPTAYINVNANSGFDIDEIKIDGVTFYGTSLAAAAMTDNGTVAITTKEKEANVYYVVADPKFITVTVDYSDIYDESNSTDGKWTIKTTNPYSGMNIDAAEGYVISSIEKVVEDGNNEELLTDYSKYQASAYQALGYFPTGTTFSISAALLSELRSAHVSIEVVDGEANEISVRRGNDAIPASDFADIAVIPGGESLYITAETYGKSLYKVTVNGEEQTPQGSGFYISDLKDGDVIKVWPNFPDVEVPLSITFTNEGTSGALALSVDGETVDPGEWQAEGYTVNLGSRLGFTLNYSDYNVTSVTMNGEAQSPYGFETTVQSEDSIKVVITAEKLRDYQVTVNLEPGTVRIFRGWGEDDQVEIPDGANEVTFSVSPSSNQLNFKAADGYVITAIVDGNDNEYSSSVYVGGDMTLTVYTDRIVRDMECVLYLQPTDEGWIYSQVTLSSYTEARKEIPVESGYTFIEYGEFDCPFQLGFYPQPDVYINGTLTQSEYGEYAGLDSLASGSVIKVFPAGMKVPTYKLTITDGTEGAVAILADYVTALDSSEAEVLGTTDLLFVENDENNRHIIKVNGIAVKADEDGQLVATIDGDSTITIENDKSTSADEIVTAGKDAPVYNMQGLRVDNPKNGIFIVNGKKVRF